MCIDYLQEMLQPGMVNIGVWMTRAGKSEFAANYSVFLGEICHATATCALSISIRPVRKSASFDQNVKAMLIAQMESVRCQALARRAQ